MILVTRLGCIATLLLALTTFRCAARLTLPRVISTRLVFARRALMAYVRAMMVSTVARSLRGASRLE
jgi:hypothetical protein